MKAFYYEPDTGKVLLVIHAPAEEDILLQQPLYPDAQVEYQDIDPVNQYYLGGQILDRPNMGLSGIRQAFTTNEVLRIDNIPPGTKVTHPEGETIVDDGFIEWSAVEPGYYSFRFENFPYMEEEINAIVR